MSLLKPFDLDIDEALAAVVAQDSVSTDVKKETVSAKDAFNDAGASLDEIAVVAARVMKYAEKDADKLKAADMALRVQGVFKDDKQKAVPDITIIINSNGTENKNLVNLVMPLQ